MNSVRLYSTEDCGLCREAKQILVKLQKEYPFRLDEEILSEKHPQYNQYVLAVPVVIVNERSTLSGRIDERTLREAMRKDFKPTTSLLLFKFLEALGFVTVAAGLFYGVTRNDEWQELYFLIAGVALFAAGRILERRELKKARREAG